MRLAELEPRWLINEPDRKLFMFLCPHCVDRPRAQQYWLCCKNFPVPMHDQVVLFHVAVSDQWNKVVVPMKQDCSWAIEKSNSWDTIDCNPSLDASAAGHWHGFIRNGQIQ